MAATAFYRRVVEETGLTLETAKRATPAVLHALRDRLTPEEARQLAAQLPREIRASYGAPGKWPDASRSGCTDRHSTRE